MAEHFSPPTLYKSSVFSHAVKAGRIIFVAGQCSHQPADAASGEPVEIIHKADPWGQARRCYQNVKYALEAAGASMKDVVKVVTYSTHPDYRRILIAVRKEFFEPPYPASTGVVVTALFDPAAMFEVEAIAVVED